MAECDWIIVCDYAFVARPTKLSVIGIFDTIYAADVPVMHERAFVSMSILGEPGESVQARLQIIGPTGALIAELTAPSTLPDTGAAYLSLELRNLKLEHYGRHAITVDVGDGHPKSAWLTLRQRQKPLP